ncbi:MAG: TRZ/ATZ family hydrolase [Gammaproteobacteria bacterium]|nr:TRZ/ATZ family hydrolase [Gammaproteobacteria bacterium]NNL06961.1 TRZ/ATZ family hydrolase [Gammaproteobacteria bacterium]
MTNIDTLLHARWIIPVSAGDPCLADHSIAIHEDRIIDILPTESARNSYTAGVEHEYGQHALIPGLINAHTHAAMSLFRGLSDDIALMDWLQNHIWPAESKWVNEDFVQCGTELAIAEMLRSGTTCFNDMYFFPDITARVAQKAGIRASVGLIVIDFPTVWAGNADEYIEKGIAVHDSFRTDDLINTVFAPHAPYTVSDTPLEKIRSFAHEMDIPVTMHVHETAHEIDEAVAKTGMRPLQRLAELGLVSPSLLAVHMTQLEQNEMDLLASSGCHVVHCPESNLKLASGFCPVSELHDRGINVALGTDGAASNNDLDMLGEMRCAALIAKGVAADPTVLPASAALRMATINGARALGIDDHAGSLEPGKSADLVAINMDSIETTPVYDPVSHLVYSCGREQVSDVWIAGRHVLKNRVLTGMDEHSIRSQAREWSCKISAEDSAASA